MLRSIPSRSSSGSTDADDVQSGLDRAELADERMRSFLEEDAGDQDVDPHPARELDRLERVLRAQDTMTGLAQRLIDQLLHGCVFLEH